MKKIIIVLIALLSLQTQAQKNVAKLGFGGLFAGNLGLRYERVMNSNTSLQLSVSYFTPKEFAYDFDQNNLNSAIKVSGFCVIPEYRYYMSEKESPQGFYVSPYARYYRYRFQYTSRLSLNDPAFDGSLKLSSLSFGGQIGWQWIIKDRFCIDWQLIGFSVGKQTYDFSLHSSDPVMNFSADTQKYLDYIDKLPTLSRVDIKQVDAQHFQVRYSPFRVGLRTGIALGFAF